MNGCLTRVSLSFNISSANSRLSTTATLSAFSGISKLVRVALLPLGRTIPYRRRQKWQRTDGGAVLSLYAVCAARAQATVALTGLVHQQTK